MKLINSIVLKRDPSLTCYDVIVESHRREELKEFLDFHKILYQPSGPTPIMTAIRMKLPQSDSFRIACTPEMFSLITLSLNS